MTSTWLMIKAMLRKRRTNLVSGPTPTQSNFFQGKSKRRSKVTIWTRKSCERASHCKFQIFDLIPTLRVRFSLESSPRKRKLKKYSHLQVIHRWGSSIQLLLTWKWLNNKRRLPFSSPKISEMVTRASSRFKRRSLMAANRSKIRMENPNLIKCMKIRFRKSKWNRMMNYSTLNKLRKSMEMTRNSISERRRWISSNKELDKY